MYKLIREKLLELNGDEQYVVDVLVKHLYKKKSRYKATLWECFGDVILSNLQHNLKVNKPCLSCGVMVKSNSNKTKYCKPCSQVKLRDSWRENKKKQRLS